MGLLTDHFEEVIRSSIDDGIDDVNDPDKVFDLRDSWEIALVRVFLDYQPVKSTEQEYAEAAQTLSNAHEAFSQAAADRAAEILTEIFPTIYDIALIAWHWDEDSPRLVELIASDEATAPLSTDLRQRNVEEYFAPLQRDALTKAENLICQIDDKGLLGSVTEGTDREEEGADLFELRIRRARS